MHLPLAPAVWTLPAEAVPFVREFVREIARRLPGELELSGALDASSLSDADGCLAACRSVLDALERARGGAAAAASEEVAERD